MPSGSQEAAAAARAAKKNKPPRVSKIGALLSLLSIVSDLKKGKFVMGNYSKFFGSIIGSLVGAGVLFFANHGMATCTVAGNADTCTILGISTAQFNVIAMAVFGAVSVYLFPANEKY